MPRKPNYKFERFERDRAKAAKKAARLRARAERKGDLNTEGEGPVDDDGNAVDGPSPRKNIDPN